MGLFGMTIPEEYGGLGLGLHTYALILIELSRGWMTLSGVLNTHFIAGLDDQDPRHGGAAAALPAPPGGRRDPLGVLDDRAARRLGRPGDPHAGGARGRRVRDHRPEDVGDERAACRRIMLLAVTDPAADPRHRGMTGFIVEKKPGERASRPDDLEALGKLGYKGVETTELGFDGFRTPASSVLGGAENAGFTYFMGGIELGRVI